jgi:HEAT repeat protein
MQTTCGTGYCGFVAAAARSTASDQDPLVAALTDGEAGTRRGAARTVADRGVAAAIPALVRLAEADPDDDVRVEAVLALDRLGYVDPVLEDGLPESVRREVEDRRRAAGRPFGLTWRRVRGMLIAVVVVVALLAFEFGSAVVSTAWQAALVGALLVILGAEQLVRSARQAKRAER